MRLVYDELHRRAAAHLGRERRGHTLQPTALVHEAYLRLQAQRAGGWRSRTHFFALASRIMRRILVDYARRRSAGKRPDEALRVDLDRHRAGVDPRACDLLLLDFALDDLARLDPRQSAIVELSFFGGLTDHEIGEALSLSRSSVARELRSAKAWLFRRMTGGTEQISP